MAAHCGRASRLLAHLRLQIVGPWQEVAKDGIFRQICHQKKIFRGTLASFVCNTAKMREAAAEPRQKTAKAPRCAKIRRQIDASTLPGKI
ncbi:hypothetical protein [Melaminivora sp.]|uniref:hypothetical protein n=1 Tax=Melaminivora sp. TaxID=1933032 RepID=UPI0028B0A078|nr:hypothetical protein [Melaminivora sp.]